jgi:O-antigen/teichoic acid export membrane protein
LNTERRIAKNTAALLVMSISTQLLSMLLVVYATRFLGDVGFGRYTLALSLSGIYVMLSDIGLSTLMVREIAKDKPMTSKHLSNAAVIKILLSIVTFVLLFATVNVMGYPEDTKVAVYILGFASILSYFAMFYQTVFFAYEKMQYNILVSVLDKLVMVALGFEFLRSGLGLLGLVLAILIGNTVNLTVSLLLVSKKFAKPVCKISIAFWKDLIKEAVPFGMIGIFGTIYVQIGIVILSVVRGDAEVGWYGAAFMMVGVLYLIPSSLVGALFPVFSQLFKSSTDTLKMAYERASKYLYIVALPIAIGTAPVADKIVLVIFKSVFANTVMALQIIVWTIPFTFLATVSVYVLASVMKQRVVMFSAGICVIVSVVLNLLLVPSLGFLGTSIASVATEMTMFLLSFYFASKYLYELPVHRMIGKPLVAAACMGAFVYVFQNFTLFVIAPIAAGIYFGLLFALKTFDEQDMTFFSAIIFGRKKEEES